jgi:hypothetical protein
MADTSSEAFKSIQGGRVAMYVRILRQLAAGDATCDELEMRCALSHQTTSARCTELRKNGHIGRTGKTRCTRSGRSAHVYDITNAGKAWLEISE